MQHYICDTCASLKVYYMSIHKCSTGPSLQTDIERSADGIDEVQTFEAGPSAVNLLVFEFALTDDSVGLEAIERYFADLTIVGTPDGVMLGALTRTTVNVLDDDSELIGSNTFSSCLLLHTRTKFLFAPIIRKSFRLLAC